MRVKQMIEQRPTNLVQLRPRSDTVVVSQGRTVLSTGRDGFIGDGAERGLFVYQTRLLSRYRYLIDGQPPQPNACSNVEQHSWLGYYIAMVSVFSPIKEMTPEEFKRVTEVTYLGFVYGTMMALKRMLPRDHGVIVQVGSGWPTAVSRSRRPTARLSTLSRASTTRSAASSSTTAARCVSPWYSCRCSRSWANIIIA
jgi:hypothetical protein